MDIHPFPGTACPAVTALTVEATRSGPQLLHLTYRLTGDLSALRIPALAAVPTATPFLWQQTCFELFFPEPGAANYSEYNFSPSLHWDHYRFSDYRQPIADAAKASPTLSILQHDATNFTLQALVSLPTAAPLDLGLTAVIEDIAGDRTCNKTYWALAHSSEKPDFHAATGFILRI